MKIWTVLKVKIRKSSRFKKSKEILVTLSYYTGYLRIIPSSWSCKAIICALFVPRDKNMLLVCNQCWFANHMSAWLKCLFKISEFLKAFVVFFIINKARWTTQSILFTVSSMLTRVSVIVCAKVGQKARNGIPLPRVEIRSFKWNYFWIMW